MTHFVWLERLIEKDSLYTVDQTIILRAVKVCVILIYSKFRHQVKRASSNLAGITALINRPCNHHFCLVLLQHAPYNVCNIYKKKGI